MGRRHAVFRVILFAAVPLAALAMLVPEVLVDPFLAHSAYPVLAGDAEATAARTAADGRWLVHAWSRAGPFAAGDIGVLFHALWALAAALVALAIFGAERRPWPGLLTAMALVFAAPAAGLAQASPELVPLALLLAGYAGLVAALPLAWAQGALLLAVPLGLMAHPLAPLALLAILLAAARDPGDGASLRRAVLVFALAAGLGAGVVLGVNAAAHGILGFAAGADDPTGPAGIADGLATGFAAFEAWLGSALADALGPVPAFGLGALLLALGVLFWRRPRRADRLFGGLALGLIFVLVRTVVTGTPPERSEALFLAVLVVCIVAWAAHEARSRAVSAALLGGLGYLALGGAAHWHGMHTPYRAFQEASRALAADLRSAAGGEASTAAGDAAAATPAGPPDAASAAGSDPPADPTTDVTRLVTGADVARASTSARPAPRAPVLYVLGGSPAALPGSDVLARHDALALRLAHLLRTEVVQCPSPHPACERHRGALALMPQRPAPGWIARAPAGTVLVRLPDGVFAPARDR